MPKSLCASSHPVSRRGTHYEIELNDDADHRSAGKDDRSPEPEPLPVHARNPKTSTRRSQRRFVNRLARATSPYLLQHARTPSTGTVGREAFERPSEDKPLLVSVGYSSCHWCHVMAHESFEDPATAALMNELFVNVKVDREERPDVDAVTMEATVGMTGPAAGRRRCS